MQTQGCRSLKIKNQSYFDTARTRVKKRVQMPLLGCIHATTSGDRCCGWQGITRLNRDPGLEAERSGPWLFEHAAMRLLAHSRTVGKP